jgi:GR25 family glycosyltransferase involved in LPS biosynthesis
MKYSPVAVINLKRYPERWIAWVKEAERMGITDYSRWEAVDGSTLTITSEVQQLFIKNDFNEHRGTIGCALSHMHLWLHIIENKVPELIILEDDARFNDSFEIPELPLGWDLFYYSGPSFKSIYPPGISINDKIMIPQFSKDLHFTTLSYRLSYSGACKLIGRLRKIGFNRAVDGFIRDTFDRLNVFCYKKSRVYPANDLGPEVNSTFKSFL